MGTTYYALKAPFTSLAIIPGGGHAKLKIWVNHAFAGELTVRDTNEHDELTAVLHALASEEEVGRLWYGGDAIGCQGVLVHAHLTNDIQVISEYGELTTIGSIRDSAKNL